MLKTRFFLFQEDRQSMGDGRVKDTKTVSAVPGVTVWRQNLNITKKVVVAELYPAVLEVNGPAEDLPEGRDLVVNLGLPFRVGARGGLSTRPTVPKKVPS